MATQPRAAGVGSTSRGRTGWPPRVGGSLTRPEFPSTASLELLYVAALLHLRMLFKHSAFLVSPAGKFPVQSQTVKSRNEIKTPTHRMIVGLASLYHDRHCHPDQ